MKFAKKLLLTGLDFPSSYEWVIKEGPFIALESSSSEFHSSFSPIAASLTFYCLGQSKRHHVAKLVPPAQYPAIFFCTGNTPLPMSVWTVPALIQASPLNTPWRKPFPCWQLRRIFVSSSAISRWNYILLVMGYWNLITIVFGSSSSRIPFCL